MQVIVLDAMGVIYSVGDDVKDLLCPFIEEKGGIANFSEIGRLYNLASAGEISASQLWQAVGLDPELEDEYLQRHNLTDGLLEFLETVNTRGWEVWCLSNDLSLWSQKLRLRFGLDEYISGFVISGDVGIRKPDQVIFNFLIGVVNVSPREITYVDDQLRNLDVAAILGFRTVLFTATDIKLTEKNHEVATTFDDVLSLLLAG